MSASTNRVVRKVIDGSSRETVFDSVRLIGTLTPEQRIVHFDVVQPDPQSIPGMGNGLPKTQGELIELSFRAMPRFSILPDGIRHVNGSRYMVTGKLADTKILGERIFTVEVDYNFRERRNSGDLVVTWETVEGDDRLIGD